MAVTTFDPATLSAFAAALGNLPREEIQKAKKLYILNGIAEFHAQRGAGRGMLIAMGVLSIIPVFLIVFIPALLAYRSGLAAAREKILNALDVWKDDLGADYTEIRSRLV